MTHTGYSCYSYKITKAGRQLCGVLPMSMWTSFVLSSFLPPPKNLAVGGLDLLYYL